MSVFTPFRSKTSLTTAMVIGGALKLYPTWVVGEQTLYAQNQQVNVAQIGGVAVVPARCDNSTGILSTAINAASTQTQVVAGSTQRVIACGYEFTTPTSTATVQWVQGTSTDCSSGRATISGAMNLSSNSGMVVPNTGAVQFRGSSGNTICINTTSTGVNGLFKYIFANDSN